MKENKQKCFCLLIYRAISQGEAKRQKIISKEDVFKK